MQQKILYKHNVHVKDVEEVIFNKPYFLKLKENRYMAIGKNHKHLTIIFLIATLIFFLLVKRIKLFYSAAPKALRK